MEIVCGMDIVCVEYMISEFHEIMEKCNCMLYCLCMGLMVASTGLTL